MIVIISHASGRSATDYVMQMCVSLCPCVYVCNHFLLARYLQKLRTDFSEILWVGVGVGRGPRTNRVRF